MSRNSRPMYLFFGMFAGMGFVYLAVSPLLRGNDRIAFYIAGGIFLAFGIAGLAFLRLRNHRRVLLKQDGRCIRGTITALHPVRWINWGTRHPVVFTAAAGSEEYKTDLYFPKHPEQLLGTAVFVWLDGSGRYYVELPAPDTEI